MNPKSANRGRNPRSFSFYLFVSVLLLVCVVILGITIVDYMYAGQNLRDNALLMQNQTESTIREDLQIVDDSLKLYDSTLNRQMEGEFAYFLEEYNRSGRDPSLMNLTAVKDRIGENTDLYIINSSGVVEHTTFQPDKNLDFKTIPYFYSYLTEVRKSDGFFPDRVVIEPATGILRKYAYMPTPDHRFVFELGFSGKELELARSALRYQERIQSLTSLNQFVEGVRIFTSRKQWEGAPGFTADEQLSKILDSVIQARSTQTFDYPDAGRRVTYMFVDLWDQRYGSDGSKVVEITYDTTLIQHALNDLIIFHVVIATGVLGVISLIALFIARLITLPVREMVDDIDIIAAGDLDHTIVRSGKGSTVSSISKMRFSRYILMYMILIIGITVAGLTAIDLVNAEQTFAHDAEIFQHQTEESLNQTIHLVDSGYKIYDDSLNREMQNRFGLFFEEYNRAGKDVSRMDLEKIKTDLGGIMDLYIINESLVIEYSTYAPDLGLDFKKYTYSRDYLQKILSSQGFYPDRIVRELSTGDFRKFAYMPTPDHRYIFELGLNGEQFKDRHGKLSYESAIQTIAGRNPYITGVLPFDMNKRMVNNYSYKPNPEKMEALGQVIDARATIEIGNVTGGTTTRYLFIDLVDPDYASDVSWILEITYDSAQIDKALNQLLGFHAMVALVALALSVVGATLLSQVLTRPVKQIVSDVEKIAHGDLDHIIVPSGGNEFEVMERSINTMVKKLKGTIEELRKKEVALIESEERYRLVVESQSEYIARFLPDGTRIFANDAYVRFFGIHHTAQDIPSPRPLSLPDEMDSFRMHLLALSPDRPSRTIENSLPLPSGDSCWQQWNLRAFFDPGGTLTEYQVVGRDITERKRMEEELRASESKFKELVGLLPQAIFETDVEGKIMYANPYTYDMLGYVAEDQEKELFIHQMISPEGRDRALQNFQEVLHQKLTGGREYALVRKDGSRFRAMVYTAPIIREGVPLGIRGTLIDLTKLKEVEEEIRRLNDELEHRVKERTIELVETNKELESFTYSVSHDLRAPLRAIDGFSGILLENYQNSLPPEAKVYLSKVRTNAQQMALLIDALLNFSRTSRSPVKKEILDPKPLAAAALEEIHAELDHRQVDITIRDLPTCSADPAMLKLVFQNLLSNALKFTRSQAKGEIEVGSYPKGNRTVYYVKDNGIGFDMRYVHKLFGVFQRLHTASDYEGTGVGLAIVQKIIQRHGGNVWAESEIGKGATFYFTLEGGDGQS